MSFVNRLKPPAYTSPSGTRQEFFYSSSLEKSFSHKLDQYEFSDLDGSYFRDLGITSDVLPFQFKFKGPNYDIDANAFEALLKEKGSGTLEHPIHGTKTVVVGTVRRVDDPVNAGGVAIFDVAFFETIELQPVETQEFNTQLADEQNTLANIAGAEAFELNLDVGTVFKEINVLETFNSYIGFVQDALDTVAKKQAQIANAFTQGINDLLNNIGTLIKEPIKLAQQTQALIQLPLLATESFQDRFTAYADLLETVLQLDGDGVSFLESRDINDNLSNDIVITELFASAATNAIVQTASLSNYDIRNQALSASSNIVEQFNKTTEILDRLQGKYENEIFFEQYFSQSRNYNEMRTMLYIVVKDIQKRLLDLAIEKRTVLQKDSHYITLCVQEYGNLEEETLKFFQDTNNIHGNDFFVLEKGREVISYV